MEGERTKHHEGIKRRALPKGRNWKWEKWKALNRLRTGVGRCKTTLKKWKILGEDDTINCKCGEIQTMGHLLKCPLIGTTCDENYLHLANDKASAVVAFWMTEI